MADMLNGASCCGFFKNCDELLFDESGFAHGYLLKEHNQYAG
ncbi:hypothetical protein KPNJ1_01874 [Klebsiella pneumoniae 30660/NJST258_1]|uniref:Uncharacterized protein n=2 Tax=Klebsiella pneumoniae TaxID=573 RepID=A0A023JM29_KLEPN|nr:hypothetical protein [Klebsiella pneumoniae subsp. pneumoniae]AHM78618.1 hypothetical protein KPNJ2_01838 [Klebsiella pneumoniae 30684/NJST258_2]AHM84280.1 hypothetical protein KPNJ1_01874 [Klebsiella pneumoniae 30660/NJST258_1]AWZ74284.1 hypothetical protein CSB99_2139 [Klebsiella pneumoniae]CCM85758.1 hypothetical protein BN426_5268 [Klebsiella pneumoniae subsp. pneumoniae ST258-K26BO]